MIRTLRTSKTSISRVELAKKPGCLGMRGGRQSQVVTLGARLVSMDISDPASPTLADSLMDGVDLQGAIGVKVSGNYAYIAAAQSDALVIVDISNPSSLTKTGSLNTAPFGNMNGASGLDVHGNYAFVASADKASLTIIDVSNPASPTQVGYLEESTVFRFTPGVVVSGNYAYLAGHGYVAVVDVADVTAPSIVASLQNSELESPQGVGYHSGVFYATAASADKILSVDVSSPASPTVLDSLGGASIDFPRSLVVDGTTAYLSSYDVNAVVALDVSVPASIQVQIFWG